MARFVEFISIVDSPTVTDRRVSINIDDITRFRPYHSDGKIVGVNLISTNGSQIKVEGDYDSIKFLLGVANA